jgi:hypothetical protein
MQQVDLFDKNLKTKKDNFKIILVETDKKIICDVCKDKEINIYLCNDVCNNEYNVCDSCIHTSFYFDYHTQNKGDKITELKNRLNNFDNNDYQNKLYSTFILCLSVYYDFLHIIYCNYTKKYNNNFIVDGLKKLINTDIYYTTYQHLFNIDLENLINYDDCLLLEQYDNNYFIGIIKVFIDDLDNDFKKYLSEKELNDFLQDYNSNYYKFVYSEFCDINVIDFIKQNYKNLIENKI